MNEPERFAFILGVGVTLLLELFILFLFAVTNVLNVHVSWV